MKINIAFWKVVSFVAFFMRRVFIGRVSAQGLGFRDLVRSCCFGVFQDIGGQVIVGYLRVVGSTAVIFRCLRGTVFVCRLWQGRVRLYQVRQRWVFLKYTRNRGRGEGGGAVRSEFYCGSICGYTVQFSRYVTQFTVQLRGSRLAYRETFIRSYYRFGIVGRGDSRLGFAVGAFLRRFGRRRQFSSMGLLSF